MSIHKKSIHIYRYIYIHSHCVFLPLLVLLSMFCIANVATLEECPLHFGPQNADQAIVPMRKSEGEVEGVEAWYDAGQAESLDDLPHETVANAPKVEEEELTRMARGLVVVMEQGLIFFIFYGTRPESSLSFDHWPLQSRS